MIRAIALIRVVYSFLNQTYNIPVAHLLFMSENILKCKDGSLYIKC